MEHRFDRPNGFLVAGYVYLLLPLVIFCIGWLRWYFALPLLAVTGLCFYLALGNTPGLWRPARRKAALLKGLAALVLLGAVTWISGVGGWVWQTGDHHYRNEIFRILVERPWPVLWAGQGLVYYIGFWLPPALIGKLFGLAAGFAAQMVWMLLGMMIFFGLLCVWRRKVALWPLVLFLFFSGQDVFAAMYTAFGVPFPVMVKGLLLTGMSLDHWAVNMMYPAMLTNFFWSFQQAVPVYVLVLVLLLQKNSRSYAFLAAPVLLSGTMAVVGMVPMGLALACSAPVGEDPIDRRLLAGRGGWTTAARDVCSLQNLLGGGAIALLLWLYFSTNHSGAYTGLSRITVGAGLSMIYWLTALIAEYGLYVLAVAKTQERNPLLPTAFLCLAACPFLQVGISCDFCMRTSMAVLPFLALLVTDTLVKAKAAGRKWLMAAIITLLALGALTPLSEIARTVIRNPWGQRFEKSYVAECRIFTEGNFSGDGSGNLFFDVLCKPR